MEATKRKAFVAVVNETTSPLFAVSVIHRHGNTCKHRQEWASVPAGERAEPNMTVDFHPDCAAAAKDWWFISWYNNELDTLCSAIIQGLSPTVAGLIATKSEFDIPDESFTLRDLARVTTDVLFESSSTVEFKEHTLREEDSGSLFQIVINCDNSVTFMSTSEVSKTPVRRLVKASVVKQAEG
ncbi:uncharacterized protein BBA_07670 [Beauveria bassiana ARSEF 2860]|uniref:Up-regulated in Daf-2 domain-containing protein n=1 Tax=Beauveria bassiana (strain ARSEF 2860) TaxID=655819 RepID=J4KM81_BEAB2|nr:uncharacterized protein BBA_07670 [Beauveria bassiana ARSEF 2860]EJP63494.1 hypothetical protein BBA_07670 [Beauveria bassiana ARSEF 2860]